MRSQPGIRSVAMIVASVAITLVVSVAMDALLLSGRASPTYLVIAAVLFNVTTVLQAMTGALIEWRRPGHLIGRLLLVSGPLYALLGASWLTADVVRPLMDPMAYQLYVRASGALSWPGVALIAGWVPLLFPSGSLPGPRWRVPALVIAGIGTAGVIASLARPGEPGTAPGIDPNLVAGWPPVLQLLIDAIPIALAALFLLAVAGLVTRYRRGDPVERLQVRWLLAAVSVVAAGIIGVLIETTLRTVEGPLLFLAVVYLGILLMPIAIGSAILRYRLYEIDRIISRTLAYTALTATLAVVYAVAFVGSQAILAPLTESGGSLAVAGSTLAVFALFQPLRRRLQSSMDHRFNRSRYDAPRIADAFAGRIRDEVDLQSLAGGLQSVVGQTLAPAAMAVWIRSAPRVVSPVRTFR